MEVLFRASCLSKTFTSVRNWTHTKHATVRNLYSNAGFNGKHSSGSGTKYGKQAYNKQRCSEASEKCLQLHRNREVVLAPAVSSRKFHTSQRFQFHPVFWLLVKPAAKVVSIISGRSFRKWWTALSEAERAKFKNKLFQSKGKIAGVVGLLVAAGLINYFTHIQEAPITHRRRYLAFTEEQFLKVAKFELEVQWANLKEKIIDPSDVRAKKVYKLISTVAQNIVDSNQDLDLMQRQKWTVVVVDDDEANAFVLPTGQIFVYTGILKLTENEDQLAVVLGHEIAHVLLSHGAEKISIAGLLDVVIIVVMAGLWAFMPSDGIAIVTQWFYSKVMKLLLDLPYSRKLEAEADEVGLQLMAKACYDVRESSTFWQRMALVEEFAKDSDLLPEWMSTHPASNNRAAVLDALIPNALQTRECSRCPHLTKVDPRIAMDTLRHILQEEQAHENPPAQETPSRAVIPAPKHVPVVVSAAAAKP